MAQRYREIPPPNEKVAKIYPKYILPSLNVKIFQSESQPLPSLPVAQFDSQFRFPLDLEEPTHLLKTLI